MGNVQAFDFALLIFRIAIGAVFIAHGVNHIFGGGKIAGTGRWFESLGMKPGWVHAWTASVTEIGAGALLMLGLLTSFGGAGVIGVMLVALITNHLKNGFFIFRPGEGWEYVMVLIVSGFLLSMVGPGGWSLDNAIGLGRLLGWDGLYIDLVFGVGGAAALLLGFWRPTKPAKAA
jgi:putative oxidoreductase